MVPPLLCADHRNVRLLYPFIGAFVFETIEWSKDTKELQESFSKIHEVRQWNLQGPMEQIGVMGPYLLPLICDEIIEGYSPKITGSPKKFP